MTLRVNGAAVDVPSGTTVSQLIERHGLAPGKVAIELNRRLLRNDRYGSELKEGDEVEIVTFVGGG